MDSSKVGPLVAGTSKQVEYAGAEIRDGKPMPFVRVIETGENYDGYTVQGPHILIEDTRFTGPLDIYATLPIVFRGVTVRVTQDSHWAIHTRPGAGAFYFLWSEAGGAEGSNVVVSTGLLLRAGKAIVYRSHISRVEDGIHADAASTSIIENLIDGLVARPSSHNDAIQIPAQARNISIERNRMVNQNPQTSCIFNEGSSITIKDNYLAGGGWVIYGGANSNGHGGPGSRDVSMTGNIFGSDFFPKSGHFGPVAYWDSRPDRANTWSGNAFSDGREIKP